MNSVKFLTSFAYVASALLLIAIVGCATPVRAQNDAPPVTDIELRDGPNPGEVIISWNAVPEATHYRIGYVNMETDYRRAKASVTGDWLEAFVYVDVDARNFTVSGGRTEYTVPRLAQGVLHAFTVLTSNSFSNTTQSVAGAFSWPSNPRWERHTVADRGGACPTAGTPQPTPSPTRPAPTPTPSPTPTPQPRGDYDADNDGLIEITNLAQLDAIRRDPEADGVDHSEFYADKYADAYPNAVNGMGCPKTGCLGYELVVDLDFDTNGNGRVDEGDDYWNDGEGWQPIGAPFGRDFEAIFDGNGHTIRNLYINRTAYEGAGDDYSYRGYFPAGLFAELTGFPAPSFAENGTVQDYLRLATIKNINLVDVNVTAVWSVGGLAGTLQLGSIMNSHVTGEIRGESNVGGLLGTTNPRSTDDPVSVIGSSAAADVSGAHQQIGGLVGSSGWGHIESSYATGNTSGEDAVGGLVGAAQGGGSINRSYASGDVTAVKPHIGPAGGLVGALWWGTPITDSYATGNVSSPYQPGLLVGGVHASSERPAYISNSYATGQPPTGYRGVGLVGGGSNGSVLISSSYWNNWSANQTDHRYVGVGKTTAELQSPTSNTGIYQDWDPDIWDFGTPTQYPVLKGLSISVADQRP